MPSDLIYREDAKDYARYAMAKGLNVLEYLDKVLAADFRPVVRGKWVDAVCSCHDSPHVRCSMCGECYWRHFYGFNFCPNCGADMRPEPPKEE